MKRKAFYLSLGALIIMLLLVSGCAPGNERFVTGPAGFWAGLWHGFICFFTFIISLFSDTVHIYEVNNTGGWYDFGFVLGVACFFGGSSGPFSCKKKTYRMGDKEWEEIGTKVEEKVKQAIREWTDETKEKDEEWEEIGRKIEDKIKRELRKWAEK
ncbi:MAG: hypothetical protein JSU61_04270 [Fidelibacterota bacterium]|nr:MAG: hypothetical protein JSU61_04270 [Candidatus Neomarinimicrobiota bacterium]